MRPFLFAVLLCTVATIAHAQPKGAPKIDPKAPYAVVEPRGHSAVVRGAAFTPDGKSVVTASQDRTVRVWVVATGDLVRVIRLPLPPWSGGVLFCMALSADGKMVATAGRVNDQGKDGSPIYLIDLETGRLIHTLNDHNDAINGLAFAPDGKRLVSSSLDQTARVWDIEAGKVETVLRGHTGGLNSVAFTPDGERITTCAADATVRIWPAKGGKAEHTITDREHPPHRVAWSRDGKMLATGNQDGSITLYDEKGKRLGMHVQPTMAKTAILTIAFTPDGRELLCAGHPFDDPDDNKTRSARIIDVGTGVERTWVGLHSGNVWAGAIAPDGKSAVTAGGDMNEVFVWRTFDGAVIRNLTGGGAAVPAIAWSADGKTIAWSRPVKKLAENEVHPLERTFHLGDLRSGAAPDDADKFGRSLRTHKGRKLAVFDGKIQVYDGDTDVSTFNPQAGKIFDVTWLGDDLYVVATERGLFLVNPEDGKQLRRFTGSSGGLTAIAPAPDGVTFATGGEDQVIRIWRADRIRPLLSFLPAGDDWIAWTDEGLFACSPGGEHLMGWQLDDGRDKLTTYSPAARLRSSLYRPDVIRHIVAAGNVDGAFAAAKATKPDKLGIANVLPPIVEITSPSGSRFREVGPTFELTATAKSTAGSPVTAMRLLVDGRPYMGEAGIKKVTGDREAKAAWSVDLPPGPHSLIVVADSANSRGASPSVEIMVPGKTELPALYVLAVGVGDYAGPLALKCAAADAGAIAKAFQDQSKSFRAVEVKVLTGKEATRAGVEAGLAWLKQKTTARDVGVFFFAGRGAVDEKGEFALTTVDMESKGLPATRLRSALSEVPGRVVVMLDAARPKSAGADDLIRDLLSEDCGAIVLSACQGAERSIEEPGAKLGYFTQAVVDGLASAGDLNEMQSIVRSRIKESSSGLMTPVLARAAGVRSFVLAKP